MLELPAAARVAIYLYRGRFVCRALVAPIEVNKICHDRFVSFNINLKRLILSSALVGAAQIRVPQCFDLVHLLAKRHAFNCLEHVRVNILNKQFLGVLQLGLQINSGFFELRNAGPLVLSYVVHTRDGSHKNSDLNLWRNEVIE